MGARDDVDSAASDERAEPWMEPLWSDDPEVALAAVEAQWQSQLAWLLRLIDRRCRHAALADAQPEILEAIHDRIFTVEILRAKTETFRAEKGSWSNYLRWAIQRQLSTEIRRLKLSQRPRGHQLVENVASVDFVEPVEHSSDLEARIAALSTGLRAVWTLRMALDREPTEPDRRAMAAFSGQPREELEREAGAILAEVEKRRQQRSMELMEIATCAKETQLAGSYDRSRLISNELVAAGVSLSDLLAIESHASNWTQDSATSEWQGVVGWVPPDQPGWLKELLKEFAVTQQRICKLNQELANAIESRRKLSGTLLPEHEEVARILHKTKSACEQAFSRANRAIFK
jgi:hypothetical protein